MASPPVGEGEASGLPTTMVQVHGAQNVPQQPGLQNQNVTRTGRPYSPFVGNVNLADGVSHPLSSVAPNLNGLNGGGIYPVIVMPNPNANGGTIYVYRSWNNKDVKRAVEGITHARDNFAR